MAPRHLLVTTILLLTPASAAVAGSGAALQGSEGVPAFRVIVNADNPVNELGREQVSTLFLNRTARWKDGPAASPVDQSFRSPVREAFSLAVLGRPVLGVKSYWDQRIVSRDREIPPPVKGSDAEVIAHVVKNKGGIGYISGTPPLPTSVKVLRVMP